MSPLYCALVHHPVRDRAGCVVTTAVTNLDVHDIARSARTYGLAGYFVVTPVEAQRQIVERILEHWRTGAGARRVPERTEALALVQIVASVAEARDAVADREGSPPRVLATAARAVDGVPLRRFAEEAETLRAGEVPVLLLFGTGHGLVDDTVLDADALLEPIRATSSYNHLSVRAAAAICLDRLVGDRLAGE
jgi:hypothetical protein